MKYSNQLTASKKIGDKSSILSPITGFQTQNRFESHRTQVPVIKPHNLNNALFLVHKIKNIALFLVHKIKNIALFLVHIDDIEYGHGISIPLWTFGLLY